MEDHKGEPITFDIIQGGRPFPQSGSWNMVDLSAAPIKGTLGALSRYSAARVNPYAVMVGETLCSIFQLSPDGRKRIDTAVEKLKVVGTLGKTLEIGFSVEDVVRAMSKTERGRICMAFCAALKECYSDDMAVEILLEMARLVKADGQLMPSSQAWKELLTACAGTLASSAFPLLAEHYMQLPKDDRRLGAYHRFDSSSGSVRSCSSPLSIAKAIFGLARVTKGDSQAVTFVGGNDTGWLAAVAQWFFELRLVIYLEGDNKEELCHRDCDTVFHRNCDPDDAQVRIIFKKNNGKQRQSLTTVGHTFSLDDISKLFSEEGRSDASMVVSGRLEWKSALSSAFASDFKKLIGLRESLGTTIGGAARLFKGLVEADGFFPMRFRAACTSYCDASYGLGFIRNTLHWFPELSPVKEFMENSAALKMSAARREYEFSIGKLREMCGCLTCNSTSTGHVIPPLDEDAEMTPAPESEEEEADDDDDDESIQDFDPDRYCLVVLAETIICLSRALANVALEDAALRPVRSGFEAAYGRQLDQRRCAPGGLRELREIGQIAFCLDFDRNFSFGSLTDSEDALDARMKMILGLFTGREVHTPGGRFSAICLNGITAFLGFLRNPSCSKEDMSRIHLIPGRITHDGKNYTKLIDRVLHQPPATNFDLAVQTTTMHDPDWRMSLSVQETYTALECLLELQKGEATEYVSPLRAGPASFVSQLAGQTGLVSCKCTIQPRLSKPCCHSTVFRPEDVENAMSTKQPLKHGGKAIFILDCRELVNFIPPIASTTYLGPEYTTYFVKRECTTCCIKAALSVDRPERREFCFFFLPL
jgi:hypothetical protein